MGMQKGLLRRGGIRSKIKIQCLCALEQEERRHSRQARLIFVPT